MMHCCPRCGEPTNGAFSEGGLRWAICEECMANQLEPIRRTYDADELGIDQEDDD